DGDYARAQMRQHPAPAARAGAEIKTGLTRTRPLADEREQLPQFQIRTARCGFVLDEMCLAVRKWARAVRRREQRIRVEQRPRTKGRGRRRITEPHGLG